MLFTEYELCHSELTIGVIKFISDTQSGKTEKHSANLMYCSLIFAAESCGLFWWLFIKLFQTFVFMAVK
jgi:hypothetical protein